jgi:hypothetical protein
MDQEQEKHRPTPWRPMVAVLIVAAGVAYASAYGLASIPPFVALLVVAALTAVLSLGAEALTRRSNNSVTSALSGVTLMLSLLSRIALFGATLWIVFGGKENPLDRLLAATNISEQIAFSFVLVVSALLALQALVLATALYAIIRANAFGTTHKT